MGWPLLASACAEMATGPRLQLQAVLHTCLKVSKAVNVPLSSSELLLFTKISALRMSLLCVAVSFLGVVYVIDNLVGLSSGSYTCTAGEMPKL